MYPFDRFSESAKGALTRAQDEAERGGQSYIGTEHLLLGLMEQEDGLAQKILTNLGIKLAELRAAMEKVLASSQPGVVESITPTSRVKRIIELSFEIARRENSPVVDTSHMLLAIVEEGQGIAAHVLKDRGVTVDRLKKEITGLRQAGQADAIPASSRKLPFQHRHLDVKDPEGRRIVIEILFPTEYSDAQCNAAAARVERAIGAPDE